MTPRRAVVVGAATGSALGLIVGIRAARAVLVTVYAEHFVRRFVRMLRDDRWRRDRYRLDPPLDLHDLQGPEVTAPTWPSASRHPSSIERPIELPGRRPDQ